jgi:hypothetical protein
VWDRGSSGSDSVGGIGLILSVIPFLEPDEVEGTFGSRLPRVLARDVGKLGERRQPQVQLVDGTGEGGDGLVDPVADPGGPLPRVLDRRPDLADE